jgi:hypothetical protein
VYVIDDRFTHKKYNTAVLGSQVYREKILGKILWGVLRKSGEKDRNGLGYRGKVVRKTGMG